MGIVKISDALHDEIRKASSTMVRSINAQAEFWTKVGILAETNPDMRFETWSSSITTGETCGCF
ncbi:ParD-like family protein [Halomonas stenophila]|uniref:ParD-like family protein n=1 Tax=Halomonas stenophila TaxID=795312 RepID=A0A7W5HML5_9GAMM|nr:ParD-like family protein [Halomonas stenophila]MBB3232558.1 hypothetical protein [Halomonas stenophila]